MAPHSSFDTSTIGNRRSGSRTDADYLCCQLGRVTNLSTTGMRVEADARGRFERGQPVDVRIETPSHEISIRAKIAWVHSPDAGGNQTLGLVFTHVNDDVTDRITRLLREFDLY